MVESPRSVSRCGCLINLLAGVLSPFTETAGILHLKLLKIWSQYSPCYQGLQSESFEDHAILRSCRLVSLFEESFFSSLGSIAIGKSGRVLLPFPGHPFGRHMPEPALLLHELQGEPYGFMPSISGFFCEFDTDGSKSHKDLAQRFMFLKRLLRRMIGRIP